MSSARHRAREYALQAIYQWEIAGTPAHEIEADFLVNQIRSKTDREYFSHLLRGVLATYTALDTHFAPLLDRKISELDPIELAILRMSTYELTERLDVPWRVVINEALELAKKFGSTEGHKYINGVLDRLARLLRPDETRARS